MLFIVVLARKRVERNCLSFPCIVVSTFLLHYKVYLCFEFFYHLHKEQSQVVFCRNQHFRPLTI